MSPHRVGAGAGAGGESRPEEAGTADVETIRQAEERRAEIRREEEQARQEARQRARKREEAVRRAAEKRERAAEAEQRRADLVQAGAAGSEVGDEHRDGGPDDRVDTPTAEQAEDGSSSQGEHNSG